MKLHFVFTAIAVTSVVHTQTMGGIDDLFVTNSSGLVYQIDGDTLQATEVVQLENANLINEIHYMGNGRLLTNLTFAFAVYDFNTQTQETLFTSRDVFAENDGLQYTSGIAELQNGNAYFTAVNAQPDGSIVNSAYSYNFQNNSFTEFADAPTSLPFDHHLIENDVMLTLDVNAIYMHDLTTGAIIDSFGAGAIAASFFETNGQLFMLSTDHDLYTVDIDGRSTSFYGSIVGMSGNAIGATIPAPSSLALLGFGIGACTRRRRSA